MYRLLEHSGIGRRRVASGRTARHRPGTDRRDGRLGLVRRPLVAAAVGPQHRGHLVQRDARVGDGEGAEQDGQCVVAFQERRPWRQALKLLRPTLELLEDRQILPVLRLGERLFLDGKRIGPADVAALDFGRVPSEPEGDREPTVLEGAREPLRGDLGQRLGRQV
jgi:hypothetical protein